MKIHYDLIGTVPAVEFLREPGALDELIFHYEQTAPKDAPEFGLMSGTDVALYMKEQLKSPAVLQRMCDGVAIELAAQHFYGLKGEDFNTIDELIEAINVINRHGDFLAICQLND